MADDILAKIAAASASGGGNWIQDGVYKFCLEKAFRNDGHAGVCFIAELKVVESSVHPNHPDVKPNPVGTTCSFVCNVTKHDSALGNIKAFVEALMAPFGYTSDQITPEVIGSVYMTEDMVGAMIQDTTYRKPIKKGPNAGQPITLNKWRPVDQTIDDVEAQKKVLRAGGYSKPAEPAAAAAQPQGTGFAQTQTTQTQAAVATPARSLLRRG